MQAGVPAEKAVLPELPESESTVVVAGVGLIGGSIAAALRASAPDMAVIGIGRDADRLEAAQNRGLITAWAVEISARTIPPGSLGVVCQPVDRIAGTVRALLRAGCGVVTDAGSTKGEICRLLSDERRFVGAHPIAGSEQTGFEHADGSLFCGRVCVICAGSADAAAVVRVERFWESLGLLLRNMSAVEHDEVLALTSHLPHVLAAVAAGVVSDEQLAFTGSGFRDTTRIAAGSAELWTSILLGNAESCVSAIRRAEELLRKFREALEQRNAAMLSTLWSQSAERRRKL
jgi:prephenate dehydrogenase